PAFSNSAPCAGHDGLEFWLALSLYSPECWMFSKILGSSRRSMLLTRIILPSQGILRRGLGPNGLACLQSSSVWPRLHCIAETDRWPQNPRYFAGRVWRWARG